jgi:hypothetical protein
MEWNLARFDGLDLVCCTKRSQGVGGVLSCSSASVFFSLSLYLTRERRCIDLLIFSKRVLFLYLGLLADSGRFLDIYDVLMKGTISQLLLSMWLSWGRSLCLHIS